jgi:hypothetical protein
MGSRSRCKRPWKNRDGSFQDDDDTTLHGFAGVYTAGDTHHHGVFNRARTIKSCMGVEPKGE